MLVSTIAVFILCIFCINVQTTSRIKRIIGGKVVENDTFPIAVSIKNSTNNFHLCGGVLVEENLVITAAHCVDSYPPENYIIKLENAHLVNDNELNENLTKANVSSIFLNDLYKKDYIGHDLAILKLMGNFSSLQKHTRDIFPKTSFGLTGYCQIYGYGVTEIDSNSTFNSLRMGTVKIISEAECVSLLGKYIAPKSTSGMICALGDLTDACQGDSGSPMICNGKLEGIVSYGMGCGIKSLPGVYTRVAVHMDWINDLMKSETCENQ